MSEEKRLAALEATKLLDSEIDERFERITRLAANALGSDMALISLLDGSRQWFKSKVRGYMSTTTIVLITLIAYKLILLGIGFWASKRVKTESDFFLAGQGLGAWTAGLSYAASTSSAWVLLGFTGIVYSQGVVGLWLVPGIFSGYVLTWLVMGPRLNAETAERSYLTVIDFITGDISGKMKRAIGIICALMILFCFV
ncbi:hypothetical protein N9M10_05415, partial [Hellea sp.]|nr:hypothetical protein [Hellea sp.]